jgi:thioredoxin 1
MTNNDLVPELTSVDFEKFIKNGLVVLDFFAEWCMPCTIMFPIFDDLNEEFKGKIKFGKINVEENRKIVEKFEINSVPSFVVLKDGKPLEKVVGTKSQEEMEEIFKKYL